MISITSSDGSWIGRAGGIAGYAQVEVTGCVNTTPVYGASAGGIVGTTAANADGAAVSIQDCRNEGAITGYQAGGIVGQSNTDTVILDCGNAGSCAGTSYAGGVLGEHYRGSVSASGCWNEGKISGTDAAGGVLGTMNWQFAEKCGISGCLNTGIVEGKITGGILGEANSETSITGSYNRGDLWWTTGGCGGGMVGSIEDDCKIQSCYNTGTISYSETGAGGIAGDVESGPAIAIQDCFWIELNGISKAVGDPYASVQVENCETLTQTDFADGTALEKLNAGEGGWYADLENVNGGFPVPAWQCASACVQADVEPGLHVEPFDLTLTLPGEGSIFYRLDEAGEWTPYTGPIRIAENCTLQAYGQYESGATPVSAFAYRLASCPVSVSHSPETVYDAPITVLLTAPEGTAYFTTDGSDPTTSSSSVEGPVVGIDHSLTLRAAAKTDGVWGDVLSFDYVISPAITPSPEAGEKTGPVEVTLRCAEEDFGIYYTVNGLDPREVGRRYDGTPIPVSTHTELKAAAFSKGGWGEVQTFVYDIAEPELITTHPSGHYTEAFYLDLSSNIPELDIYVTTGTVFHKYESQLDRPMYQDATVRVQLRYQDQVVREETLAYTFPALEVTADPETGNKSQRAEVDLDCTLGGLELRYTLDGSTPTPDSPLYEDGAPIPIVRSCTLKVAVFLPGGDRAAGSWEFGYNLLLPEVTAEPEPGAYPMYPDPLEVALDMTAPSGASASGYQIYYTTDGSDPAEAGKGLLYTAPIEVTGDVTIRAVPILEIESVRILGVEGAFPYQARTYSLTVNGPERGGAVSGTVSGQYQAGTQISLTARADEGYRFDHWQVTGASPSGLDGETLNFSMPVNAVTVTPVFRREMPAAGTNGMFQGEVGQPDENAIFISTPEELAVIGIDSDYPLDGSYVLTADLDLSGYENWSPIGTHAKPFTGTFDGQGHVISNLTINDLLGYAGLFGRVSETGLIKNLGLENISITVGGGGVVDAGCVGGIAGRMGGNDGSSAELRNCYVTGRITASYDSGSLYLGGLAGELNADVSDCFNLADLSGKAGSDGDLYMGGLAGMIDTYLPDHYVVERCFNAGTLKPSCFQDVAWVGGIVGYLSNQVELSQCYNTADVWMSPLSWCGRSAYLGGIAGFSASDVTDCYNLGDVGTDRAGSTPYYTMLCGGIVGQFVTVDGQTHEFSRCYNAGAVVSRSYYSGYAGGIVGDTVLTRELKIQDCVVASPRIGACDDYMTGSQGGVEFQSAVVGNHISMGYYSYYLNTVENVEHSSYLNKSNAFSATSSQILGQDLYEDIGWDFNSIWAMDAGHNGGLPYFQWQGDGVRLADYSSGAARIYCGAAVQDVAVWAASYDESGRMLDVSMARPGLEAGMNTVFLPLEDTGAEIRVFLLQDGTWEPLAAALRR